jgi:hypothetical protein
LFDGRFRNRVVVFCERYVGAVVGHVTLVSVGTAVVRAVETAL